MNTNEKIVHLNVGGTPVSTLYLTLEKIPYFAWNLREWESNPERIFFIDYDYQRFLPVLNWARNELISIEFIPEAEISFFSLGESENELDEMFDISLPVSEYKLPKFIEAVHELIAIKKIVDRYKSTIYELKRSLKNNEESLIVYETRLHQISDKIRKINSKSMENS